MRQGKGGAEVAAAVDQHRKRGGNGKGRAVDAGYVGRGLGALRAPLAASDHAADTYSVRFTRHAFAADIDVATSGREIITCINADRDVAGARGVAKEGVRSDGRIAEAVVQFEGDESDGGVGTARV